MTHPTDALRLVSPHKDITENLRQAAADLHPWFVGDAKTFSVDCALPAYLNDAADEIERLRSAAPASPLPEGGGWLGAEHLSAAITRLKQVTAGDEIEATYADFTFPGHTFRADIRALLSALPAAPTGAK